MNKEEKLSLIQHLKEHIPEFGKKEEAYKIFPWEDVVSSIEDNLDDIDTDKECCAFCGRNIVSLYFSSPEWTWESMLGCAGYMKICVNCGKQLHFDCTEMN